MHDTLASMDGEECGICNSVHGITTTLTIGEVDASASHVWRDAPFTSDIFLK